jgi:uncharacterized protein YodC (DUF2158 family)
MTISVSKGLIVRLKSGGPTMTVADYDSHKVECVWFDGTTKKSANFDRESLEEASQTESGLSASGAYSYCKGCGALPNTSDSCPVYQLGHHSFVRSGHSPVCKYCGKVPGPASPCPNIQGGTHVWT